MEVPSAPGFHVMALNDTKAGMTGLDTVKINDIIQEASKGSKFYEAKAKSQKRIDTQVKRMKDSLRRITDAELKKSVREMDRVAEVLRSERDLSRTIIHVDMDAFYAAIEMRDEPSLKDKPMAVGGMGMLSTSNYLARKFGVRAGMPGFIGKKLCPDLILVQPNFDKYRAVSEIMRDIFKDYDPNFSPMSLDEAYLDITDYLKRFPHLTCEETTNAIRQRIFEKTELTASAGIACNTLLAKICSDQNKPNGQFFLKPDEATIMKFIENLSIRKVNGIGNVTEQLLSAIGVNTCKDLYERRGEVKLLFSETSSNSFLRISLGIGSTHLTDWTERERKSMSNETTFRDTSNLAELMEICQKLSLDLARDMQKEGLSGRAVTLKIKTHKFQVKTKVSNLLEFTSDPEVIASSAKSILRFLSETADEKPLTLRLMGVRISEFHNETEHSLKIGKQRKIDSFLKTKSEDETPINFTCPICNEDIEAVSENSFNYHLDKCLAEQHEADDGKDLLLNNNNKRVTTTPTTNEQDLETHFGSRSKKAKVSEEGQDKRGAEILSFCAESCDFSCPICFNSLTGSNLSDINRHIDRCLNTKEKHSKHSKNSIKSYFQVK